MDAPHATKKAAAGHSTKENKENGASTAQTPPRKAPARDKLKPLAMPKALKI